MANPKQQTNENTETPKRSFAFTATFTPVPKEIPKTQRATDLPFKGLFAEHKDDALEGKQPHFFIPDAYWTEERGAEKAKVNKSYGRAKIMDQWREWAKAHKLDGQLEVLAIYREKGLDGAENPEPGLSFWIMKKSAA